VTRLLVDTHALLWWLIDHPSLPPAARAEIGAARNEALVSTASVWEIAIKRSLGKLTVPDDLLEVIVGEGFNWLPVSAEHAWAVAGLPRHHDDPFDRLLISQARAERIPIVTGDERFDAYEVDTRW
jgi:PIN domain nuclease of toxin-antitoxin system